MLMYWDCDEKARWVPDTMLQFKEMPTHLLMLWMLFLSRMAFVYLATSNIVLSIPAKKKYGFVSLPRNNGARQDIS